MSITDITPLSLFFAFLLLAIPVSANIILKTALLRSLLTAVLRMSVQLFLVGLFLEYLFLMNNSFINMAWLVVMVVFATYSVIRESKLNLKIFAVPLFTAFILANTSVLLYFNALVINLSQVLDARYLVAVGGMLLGNSLNWNIVGINKFYQDIRRDESRYLYCLAAGANQFEAVLPYFRRSLIAALSPVIASMATMGLVFLPGLMTGQILTGLSPVTAIKYQVAIMMAILSSTTLSICLSILFTGRTSFTSYGIIKKEIFAGKPGKGG